MRTALTLCSHLVSGTLGSGVDIALQPRLSKSLHPLHGGWWLWLVFVLASHSPLARQLCLQVHHLLQVCDSSKRCLQAASMQLLRESETP